MLPDGSTDVKGAKPEFGAAEDPAGMPPEAVDAYCTESDPGTNADPI